MAAIPYFNVLPSFTHTYMPRKLCFLTYTPLGPCFFCITVCML